MTLHGNKQESLTSYLEAAQETKGSGTLCENKRIFPKDEISTFARLVHSAKPANGKNGKNGASPSPIQPLDSGTSMLRQLESSISRCCEFIFNIQTDEGYWWHELESNVTITAQYVMLLSILGRLTPELKESMAKYLLNQQSPNGSWALYYGHEGELSITIESYFALKLSGEDPESEPMKRARDFILKKGGIEAARVFTKIWLALFSQYDWRKIPSMPVELVLLPPEFYFNIYEFSSWARGTIVPLSIVMAIRPTQELPPDKAVPELYLPEHEKFWTKGFASYTHKIFHLLDRAVKWFEQRNPLPSLRRRAIHEAESWIIDHQEETGDWGGIQPPMVYSILALHFLGYPLTHEIMVKGMKALEGFCLEDGLGLRMQSCISPVWDTALTAIALIDAEIPAAHPAIRKASSWLVDRQVKTGGDWQFKNCCPPGGWAFEFVNTRYPDVDDSAVVLIAMQKLGDVECEGIECARTRGMDWCLSMQCQTGGWAAFDKDNLMVILNRIPFADQEAMVDYPTADVTGRMLEAMGYSGYAITHPRAQRAIEFLKALQEPDGSWWGRWGVNYIYGTWSVLRGLVMIGENMQAPYVRKALQWLKDQQNADGGWGETCDSYRDPRLRGIGPSTASQTAWAIMGLLAGGEEESLQVRRGIQYLLRNQKLDGSWDEDYFTGTGFPNHFYIRYHGYRLFFPLMALGQYRRRLGNRFRS